LAWVRRGSNKAVRRHLEVANIAAEHRRAPFPRHDVEFLELARVAAGATDSVGAEYDREMALHGDARFAHQPRVESRQGGVQRTFHLPTDALDLGERGLHVLGRQP
jgi:hypothetical protein